jgi:hypothetical protein
MRMTSNKTETNVQTFPVLSIDAWGNQEDGYYWNQWFNVGTVDVNHRGENRDTIRAMIDAGYLKAAALESTDVEDDDYNLVIVDKKTGEPLFAIEYWPVLNAQGE